MTRKQLSALSAYARGLVGWMVTVAFLVVGILFGFFTPFRWQSFARAWATTLLWILKVPLRVTDQQRLCLKRTAVGVVNHVSFLDAAAILLACPRPFVFVFEKLRMPLLSYLLNWALQRSGHIMVNRKDSRESLRQIRAGIVRAQESGLLIVLFAEGERTTDGRLGEIQPGALRQFVKAKLDVLVMGTRGLYAVLPRTRRCPRPGPVEVQVGGMIPGGALTNRNSVGEVQTAFAHIGIQ